ncbi:tripartite tricarboxylate transporter TctB family protein [Elioraea sp.]|uniref:tripartite tricarboxylate transporter TctB family protein n=1 Tax=Elioraea sp. TaxID=2185103 RepID=UPI0025BCB1F0|nr:tripartite tricarboxylate transporter TctB family protein [Elioraea sp.]
MSRAVDAALGAGALALAGAYGAMATAIPVSMLSDAVGPGGVPLVVAGLLAFGGAGVLIKTALVGGGTAGKQPDHQRAAGLFVILVAYVVAVPLLGYPLAVGILAAAVAFFAGGRGIGIVAFAAALAGLFWFGFVKLLGIPFPSGLLFGG